LQVRFWPAVRPDVPVNPSAGRVLSAVTVSEASARWYGCGR
jgi:hypothetical protein